MDKVAYSFVKDTSNIVFRSKVNSFNLEHVTDKDIRSFYTNFSNYAAFDTGLMPLDGTGVLSIRKAGPYTQVVYQHKPGQYYVNWGQHERDPDAKNYLLAQPYRILIIDFKDNNLLGARTFYSIVPATYPDIQLYHVNLPNINCKGYRGNAVGWICLYHNTDWSHLPFNERLALAVERCSGVEPYNDANMSETDGPRLYREMFANDSTFSYLWDPQQWEEKTSEEGVDWTLQDNVWIPIHVQDIDSQDRHVGNGVPLTLRMAITGAYQAYYTDKVHIKPITALQRNAGVLESKDIMDYFVRSYNNSVTNYAGIDPYEQSQEFRQNRTKLDETPHFEEDEEQEEEEHDEDNGDEDGPF
jgi:hypothetical protein